MFRNYFLTAWLTMSLGAALRFAREDWLVVPVAFIVLAPVAAGIAGLACLRARIRSR